MTQTSTTAGRVNLLKYAWLSIITSVVVIALKMGAYVVSHSVGLLSDAAESLVNLAAAIIALIALRVAQSEADDGHHYGHSKAEYFSAAAEGMMIFIAAVFIIWTAVMRLLHPAPLENVGLGLVISVIASIANGACAWVLIKAGREHRSATLVADGKHLLTDVFTSVGVLVGVGLVLLSKLVGIDAWWLDPAVAIAVGLNIVWTGWQLLHSSADALLDATMPEEDNAKLAAVLEGFRIPGQVDFHGLRTRVAGRDRFGEMHLLLPGTWTMQQAHDVSARIDEAIEAAFPGMDFMTHLEPIEEADHCAHVPHAEIDLSSHRPDA